MQAAALSNPRWQRVILIGRTERRGAPTLCQRKLPMFTALHPPCRRRLVRVLRIGVSAAAALGCCAPLAAQSPADADPLRRFNASVEALVKRISPSIVQISAVGYGAVGESDRGATGLTIGPQHAIGSGFIVDSAGYIITNAHVVSNAQQVEVSLPSMQADGTPAGPLAPQVDVLPATIVGIAPELDLAVIKVDGPTRRRALPLASYGNLRQGQVVFAFGSPGGLQNSVTMGILSATARQPNPDSPLAYIQTDAPINPGSSGGPLVNVNGEVVGVNTFILSQSGGNEGLGFAIPSAVVKIAFQQIRQFGHVHRGEIGLEVQTISPGLAAALNLTRTAGIIISDVFPGGSAETAGVQIGDIVTAVDGMPVSGVPFFRFQLITHGAGETVHLDVLRGAAPLAFDVRVMQRPHEIDQLASLADPAKSLVRRLGIIGIAIDPRIAGALPGLRAPFGVLVAARAAGSTADVPLVSGDVIRALNGESITTVEGLRSALQGVPRGVPIALQIQRDEHLMFVSFTLDGP
jgi:serine protease Do